MTKTLTVAQARRELDDLNEVVGIVKKVSSMASKIEGEGETAQALKVSLTEISEAHANVAKRGKGLKKFLAAFEELEGEDEATDGDGAALDGQVDPANAA